MGQLILLFLIRDEVTDALLISVDALFLSLFVFESERLLTVNLM